MRSVLYTFLALSVILAGLHAVFAAPSPSRAPAANEPAPTFIEYEGTFSDLTFPNGKRTLLPRRLVLLVSAPQGVMRRAPIRATSLIRVIDPASGKVVHEYRIVNGYGSSDVECYLGLSFSGVACTLLLQHEAFTHVTPADRKDTKLVGRLILSDRRYVIQVDGTFHFRPRASSTP